MVAPSTSIWEPVISVHAVAAGIDIAYALKWIDLESEGNPCAIGQPGAKGPDGFPREMGIAQFYNPDDLQTLGLKSKSLRAYCVGNGQHLNRNLTSEEMEYQAKAAIDLMCLCRAAAEKDLRKVGAAWDRGGRDFWALVKLQHGLPGISRVGLARVTEHLGHPPIDWPQFVENLALVKLDDGTEHYRDQFARILKNAEDCSSVIRAKGYV